MRIPYCFLDENHFPSSEPYYFEDEPGSGKYMILLAQNPEPGERLHLSARWHGYR